MGFWVLRFRVQGFGLKVQGVGFGVESSGLKVHGLKFQGLGCGVYGFKDEGSRFRVEG